MEMDGALLLVWAVCVVGGSAFLQEFGLATTAFLALAFLGGTALLPEPAPFVFGLAFTVNAVPLLTNLVPVRVLDGGQMLSGLRLERLQRESRR